MVSGIGNLSSTLNSLRALRTYRTNSQNLERTYAQMSTGRRINRGADDPAGLIASESLAATLAALEAETNANARASDQAAVADGAMGQVSDLLAQAKGLVHANANTGGLSADEKAANQMEIDSIVSAVNRISATTRFNGQRLLDGNAMLSASGSSFTIASAAPSNLGKTTSGSTTYSLADLATGRSLATTNGTSDTAAAVVDQAIKDVATRRGALGAFDANTLQTRSRSIDASRIELMSALSMLRDTSYVVAAAQASRSRTLQSASLMALTQSLGRRRVGTFSITA